MHIRIESKLDTSFCTYQDNGIFSLSLTNAHGVDIVDVITAI